MRRGRSHDVYAWTHFQSPLEGLDGGQVRQPASLTRWNTKFQSSFCVTAALKRRPLSSCPCCLVHNTLGSQSLEIQRLTAISKLTLYTIFLFNFFLIWYSLLSLFSSSLTQLKIRINCFLLLPDRDLLKTALDLTNKSNTECSSHSS